MRIVEPTAFDYEQNKNLIEQLKRAYPFLRVRVVSRTCLGRAIFSLSLGNEKNSVLYAGAFHGCEWLTALVLFRFAEELCKSIDKGTLFCGVNIARAFEQLGVTIIPCVNPDGVEIAVHGISGAGSAKSLVEAMGKTDYSRWNANAMGVDINHNFNAGWDISRQMERENGINSPSPRQFGGYYPESEAETKALARLCRSVPFRQALALHSQGEEIYWQYGDDMPSHSHMMVKILAESCGYQPVQNEGLASHAGFKDWFISEFHRPAFTFEMGKGKNPLPVSQLEPIYEKLREALTVFALM